MNNFSTDLFNKVKDIRKEFRHTESPKEIYGILSVLLHNLAGIIVDIDDKGAITQDLYPLLLQIAAECQYGCEQIKLIDAQLELEQSEEIYKKKYEELKEKLSLIYGRIQKSRTIYQTIQKGQYPIKFYEITPELLNLFKNE